MININSSSRYRLNKIFLKKSVKDFLYLKGINDDKIVNIVFVGRNKMKKLSSTYKNEPIALPVLSFPYNEKNAEGENLLGEIIICYPQAVLLAAERNRKVEETLINLIKHGIENLLKN